MLLGIQSRATQSNVAQTARNITKLKAQTFASWLEKDLGRMGANMGQDERIPFEDPESSEIEGGVRLTEEFTYYRDEVDSKNSQTRLITRYTVDQVEEEPKALYQLTRKTKEKGVGSWSDAGVEGKSSPTLGYFQLDMLDEDGDLVASPTSNFDQVRSIRVRFSVLPPFQNEETILHATHIGSFLLVRQEGGDFDTPGDDEDDEDDEDDDEDDDDDEDEDDDDDDDHWWDDDRWWWN